MATQRDLQWADWTAYDTGGDRMRLGASFNSTQDGEVTADTAYLDVYADIVAIYDIGVGSSISDSNYYFKRDAGFWGAWGPGMNGNISGTGNSEGRVYKTLNSTHAIRIWLQFGTTYDCQLLATHGNVEKISNSGNVFTATLHGSNGVWGKYPRRPYHAPNTPTNGSCWVDDVNGKMYLQISGHQNDHGQDHYWALTDFTIWRSTDGQWHETYELAGNATEVEWDIVPNSYYMVGARSWNSDGGHSAWSPMVDRYSKPDAPSGVSAGRQADRSQVLVSWTNNADYPDNFLVERSVDAGTTWTLAGTVTSAVFQFTDTAPLDKDPIYRVQARTPANQALSDYSASSANAGYGYRTPDAPSLTLTRVNDTSATITVSGNQSNPSLDKYWGDLRWETKTDSGLWSSGGTVNGDVQSIPVSGLSVNRRYQVQARAWNAAGPGAHGQSGYIYTTPTAPTDVTAARVGVSTTVTVGWTNAAAWAGSYVIERSVNGLAWGQVGTSATTSFTDILDTTSSAIYRVKTVSLAPAVPSAASASSASVPSVETMKWRVPGIQDIYAGTTKVFKVMCDNQQIWLG